MKSKRQAAIDRGDEVVVGVTVARDGSIAHAPTAEALGVAAVAITAPVEDERARFCDRLIDDVAAAKQADAIIFVGGISALLEGEEMKVDYRVDRVVISSDDEAEAMARLLEFKYRLRTA